MDFQNIIPDESIALFVRNILVFENESNLNTSIPFFADGYIGLMYQESESGLIVKPHNKIMPEIFLYGQTINPITLDIRGAYKIIIFQLYPFVLKAFWQIIPESINDGCYYLENTVENNIDELRNNLMSVRSLEDKVKIISDLLLRYFELKKNNLDYVIRQSIQHIINKNGIVSIRDVAESERMNIRTFERRFLKETGLSAKQFAKIIQFQSSLEQLQEKDYKKLTDIVYKNGFSDQSHFIRVFKSFTGYSPKKFSATGS